MFNSRSIARKWPAICSEIDLYSPGIIAITETWLSDDSVKYYNYTNFQQFSACRPGGGGGGVMLLFSNKHSVVQLKLPLVPPPSCDVLAVRDVSDGHCWVLVYRPSDNLPAVDTRLLYESIHAILLVCASITILGDFNLNSIQWPSELSSSTSPLAANRLSNEFLELCASFDLKQLVTFPTRGDNFLDLILTTNPEKFSDIENCPPILTSDHNCISCVCHTHMIETINKVTLVEHNFHKCDYAEISSLLASLDWRMQFVDCRSVNEYWNKLYSVLWKIIETHVPVSSTNVVGFRKNAISRNVRGAILRKRKAWRKWRLQASIANKIAYKRASRDCSRLVRGHRAKEEEDILHFNQRRFFSYVSTKLHPVGNDITLTELNETLHTPDDIAKCFLQEFSKNFSAAESHEDIFVGESNRAMLEFINIDPDAVKLMLLQQPDSAAGPDGIPGVFYRKLANVLALPLSIVYQQSIHQGSIPDNWRLANVTPIYKGKGLKNVASSYRPISLTNVASKVLSALFQIS